VCIYGKSSPFHLTEIETICFGRSKIIDGHIHNSDINPTIHRLHTASGHVFPLTAFATIQQLILDLVESS
jgi:hypothetical protein